MKQNSITQEIDQSAFNSWKSHPVTVELLNRLNDNLAVLKNDVTNINIFSDKLERLIAYNAGIREALEKIINLDAEDFITKEKVLYDEETA